MEGSTQDTTKAAATSSAVGTLLCATRMRLGKDLQHIAQILHIRYTYLVAMEDGRYEDLPGQAYAIGFVRAYADHLGLDGDEIVRRYKEESSGLKNRPVFEFPLPTPDSGVPSGALILIAVVLGMIVYGVWYAIAGSNRDEVQVIQEVPDRLVTQPQPRPRPDPLPVDGAAVGMDLAPEEETIAVLPPGAFPPPPGATLPGSSAPVSAAPMVFSEGEFPSSGPQDSTEEDVSGGDAPAGVTPPQITNAPPPASAGTPATPSGNAPQVAAAPADVVEVRAKSDVWITLRTSGNPDRTQLLRKGEVFRAPEGGGMTLVTATPGELDILVNGAVMPSLDAGVFAKGVPLDPQRLKGAGPVPAATAPAAKPAP